MEINLIRKYRVCPESFCDTLTDWFEASPSFHVKRDDEYKNFTEININQCEPELVPLCTQYILRAHELYMNDLPLHREYLEAKALEEFRVKRYVAGGEQFNKHVDVGDSVSCKRQLAFLIYLNDDYKGGITDFGEYLCLPKKGDILVFPPMWMFPHAGLPVTKGTKYIMSSYLHYT